MADEDLRTVHVKDDIDEDLLSKAPVAPSELADAGQTTVDGGVMGAVTVQDVSKSGTWNLELSAGFATYALDVVTVDDRLEPGTYVLMRVDNSEGGE